jgi:hypothetical protein
MLTSIAKHRGLNFTLRSTERIVGKPTYYTQEILTKLQVAPVKIYAKILSDANKNTELLYVAGANNNKMRVNVGKVIPTLSLMPTSSLLTKQQHHSLPSTGMILVSKIVTEGVRRADAAGKFDEVFHYDGLITYDGHSCHKISINDAFFGYKTVTAQADENIETLSKRLLICTYHLMLLNGYKNLDEHVGGKTIKGTTTYSQKTILYLDATTYMPVYQEMSDDKGVFEKYEYRNLVVDPPFKADEFTEKFIGYHF